MGSAVGKSLTQAESSHSPSGTEVCIHDLISKQACTQPEAPAICAWNGQFTYSELETHSSSFGAYLADKGVGPEVYVPLCLEKSRWVPVAILGVLKAGGAFVLLDPSHPVQRMQEVCHAVNATMIVTSRDNTANMANLGLEMILVDDNIDVWPKNHDCLKATVKPDSVAYSMFTSGTSGTPKGAMIEHRSFSASALAHSSALNMNSSSRVLQFTSYAFDVSLLEILTTLIVGGCVCIPEEADRKHDLAGASRRLGATFAILTPSLARVLEAHNFAMLETLVLAGEAVQAEDIQKWSPHMKLIGGYGPTEAAVLSMVVRYMVGDVDASNLGQGVGITCWVVDANDHNQLWPIGRPGELLLDGPSVGRGYINDPARTAEVFIDPPAWHRQIRPGARGKLYKTGDLVSYNAEDGSIRYVGRKDNQVKLNGQRLELDEVETHIRRLFGGIRNVVVEVVALEEKTNSQMLIAFILEQHPSEIKCEILDESESSTYSDSSTDTAERSSEGKHDMLAESQSSVCSDHSMDTSEQWILEPSELFQTQVQLVQTKLRDLIPEYMIPAAFLPLQSMPLMISGKSDRRRLRSLASSLTRKELEAYTRGSASLNKQEPLTPIEWRIQQLWAEVLQISNSNIGRDDSFLNVGGDSLAAIKLASAARREGFELTVGHIYSHQTLADMAATLSTQILDPIHIAPFSLLSEPDSRDVMVNLAIQQCQLSDENEIEDIYPCTSLQSGLMALTAKRPGAYTAVSEYELPVHVDIQRFKKAWDEVVHANPILRTRIVQASSGLMYQIVVRGNLPWESFDDHEPDRLKWQDWKMGQQLVRLYIRQSLSATEPHRFILVLHHAVSDGWALSLLLEQAEAAYRGVNLQPRPFNSFIEYISRTSNENDAFWKNQFADLNAAAFPALPSPNYVPNPSIKRTRIITNRPGGSVFTISNRMRLAWAILLSLYTKSPDVVLGSIVTGRGAPVLGVEKMTGPTIAAIPVRLRLNPSSTIAEALCQVQENFIVTIPFEQAGLQHIKRMGPEAAEACQFQSLLVVQSEEESLPSIFANSKDLSELSAFSTYAITLNCQPSRGCVEVEATFDPQMVDEVQMGRMLCQLQHLFQQITPSQSGLLIRDINTISSHDWSELTHWNGELTAPVYSCAYEFIHKQCLAQPNETAVCDRDGNVFTYNELDQLSSDLALYLIDQGVGAGVFIPLCFEKSRWTCIAILGVIRAGGAFILLDPSHPISYLQEICQDANAPFVISSEWNATLAESFVKRSILLGNHHRRWIRQKTASCQLPTVNPENPMYAVFTSGLTSEPKGAIISHVSWCTSAQANRTNLFLDSNSRVLQFAPYASDISIADHLLTLAAGGCICVDQNQQGNLAESINTLQANWACMTPSAARSVTPTTVPSLRTLVLGGEAIAADDILLWSPQTNLIRIYGSAECAILTTLNRGVGGPNDADNIGSPSSAACWIVNANDDLVPIGAIGELLIEGPIVGSGYLGDPRNIIGSIVASDQYPVWLSQFRPGGVARLCRTGDLVKYTGNGSLHYIGRKGQIELRGQLVHLSEVESHIRQCFSGVEDAIAEVVVPTAVGGQPTLIAFILLKHEIFKISDEYFKVRTEGTIKKLKAILPSYMVPTDFIPLNSVPHGKSGKVDRKFLRTVAAELSRQQAGVTATSSNAMKEPATDVQRLLHELFVEVIKIPAGELSIDGNFFWLGGDSIVAMSLVTKGREKGLLFTVADIFEHPTIISLAKKAKRHAGNSELKIQPFALIGDGPDLVGAIQCAMDQCQVERNDIDDVYPCTGSGQRSDLLNTIRFSLCSSQEMGTNRAKSTPLQEGLMALATKNPGTYTARFEYLLPRDIDLKRFQKAWNAVYSANSILRTRIIQSVKHGTLQVVLNKPLQWEMYNNDQKENGHLHVKAMGLGAPLMRMALVLSPNKTKRFIWIIHHALYDGWSLPLLWDHAKVAYEGRRLQPQPFNRFIQYLSNVRGGDEFWTSQLSDLNAAIFPPLIQSDYSPNPDSSFTYTITNLPGYKKEYTLSSVIQLAWAVVLSHYTDSLDVVFGFTVNGRTAPIECITEVTGPTIATVPFRVSLIQEKTIHESLSDLQRQGTRMIPFLQHGLQNIRRLSADAAQACEFQTHLGIQPPGIIAEETLGWLEKANRESFQGYEGFVTYAFTMICHLQDDSSDLQATVNYDSSILENIEAHRLVQQFQAVIRQLLANSENAIREVQVISAEDLAQLAEWNGQVPSPTQETLHELILSRAIKQPNSEAVCAWDGGLTYQELDDYSARLAHYLLNLGITPEARVAVCLEKSRWAIVTLLAVLRSGAVCILIDPGYPRQRIKLLVKKTVPQLLLVSEIHDNLVNGLGHRVILTGEALLCNLPLSNSNLPDVLSSQAAFILFTSGSTGTPKAIVMEHVNLSTSICAHSSALDLNSATRSLHFASYAFDASIYEVFETLICGGTLCIPSEHDRMNNLANAICQMRITWAVLTPSTLNLFQPEDVPSLKTLVLAGEKVTRVTVDKWASKLTLINAYGPGEGTCCTVGSIPPIEWQAGTIGHMMGSVGWIVSPSDSSKLAAIGSVGELIIEGPVVTRGYLDEPEKTAAVYIDRPAWLRTFREANGTEDVSYRLYKTGDLVQYNGDGSIRFHGRKDSLIKLRGQRLELGEVEHHIRRCFPTAAEVIAEIVVPKTNGSSPILIACIWLCTAKILAGNKDPPDEVGKLFILPDESFHAASQEAETSLMASIPAYMVPTLFLSLRQVPLTQGGKVDRRRLREACSALLLDRIHEYTGGIKSVKRAPTTSTERTLHGIWARVLNREPDSFGVDDSFFKMGGDSISSMQVVAQCAAAGLKSSVAAIFQAKTIARISLRIHGSAEWKDEELNVPFDLTPIQQMFFETVAATENYHYFNQSMVFRLTQSVPSSKIESAIKHLVTDHSMIRARFSSSPTGAWAQIISDDVEHSYRFQNHRLASIEAAAALVSSSPEALDIEKGPLLVCDLIHVEDDQSGGQFLSLIVHNLVIDHSSWGIILADLEALIATGKPASAPTLSFQPWSQLLAEYHAAADLVPAKALPNYCTPNDYWGLNDGQSNSWEDALEERFSLSKQVTEILLGSANDTYKTQPVELMHAAILQSFMQIFTDRPTPVIFNTEHGRDPWDQRIDLTRTVGCFTTIWPADVEVKPEDDLLEIVRRTKDARRKAAGKVSCYFDTRHLHPEHATAPLEILLNYRPELHQDPTSVLQPFSTLKGRRFFLPKKTARLVLVDVLVDISDSRLSFTFIFNSLMRYQPAIRQWIQNCKLCLESAALKLAQQTTAYTLSDFPLLVYSYPELDDFFNRVVSPLKADALEVEDAYPCTPIQDGMLLSQAKCSTQYFNKWYWSVHSQDDSVDPERLIRAWKQVVQKHPLLRTVFYTSPYQNGSHDQLVLKQVPSEVCAFIPASYEPLKTLQEHQSPAIHPLRPQNRLTICSTVSGNVACLLEISHTLIDGVSAQIFFHDLRLAYDNRLEPIPNTAYRDYVKFIQDQSMDDAYAYWEDYLRDVEPCFLPKSPMRQFGSIPIQEQRTFSFTLPFGQSLREFCSKFDLTMASVFQLGWALVLRTYLNDLGACFGYITSGRDAPIPNIDNTVGPFINILICRISPREGERVIDLLRRNQADFLQSLTHQHLSLAEKMKSAGRSEISLFNTLVSILRDKESSTDALTLEFSDFGGDNPTEYDLTVNIELLENGINVALEYLATFLSDEQAQNLADTFQQALLSIISGPQKTVPELNMFGALSRERVGCYNEQVPVAIEKCLHDLIHERCLAQPFAPAVCAWDGNFSYSQVDQMSSILASDLVRRGVGPEVFVPLCFEKSRWTCIALLGIIKAGGAFVLLDPSIPLIRLQSIAQDTNASLILTSEREKNLAGKIGLEVVIVSENSMNWCSGVPTFASTSKPSNALYAVFTSGSTGAPKGVVIEHRSFATSSLAHGAAHQLRPDSRVLQFTSYAWDVNIVEHLSTLIFGGCICIPSEEQRREDFVKVVAMFEVNWAFLTPSMSRVLDPSKFKALRTLVIGGDVITAKELLEWSPHVDLYSIYGPSEAAVFTSSSSRITREMNDGRNLGRFLGCSAWVVSPDDHNKLLPVGAVGEMLIDGPIVGRDYLNNPAQSVVFISAPIWHSSFRRSSNNRFYKTGDLVRYTNGGELQFIGRKDFQVKLRGQRIELGEVEQHLSCAFQGASDAVAEIITPVGGNPMLVAFVCLARENALEKVETKLDSSTENLFCPSEQFFLAAQAAEQQLSKIIPAFMVPTVFFPIRYVPRTTHNKTNRRRLREAIMSLTPDQLQKYNSIGISKQQPSTEDEILLQRVWARVLNKTLESIGIHDSFFRLGGDSISAMQVASQSSSAGMSITVADIFRCKTISQLSLVIQKGISAVHAPEIINSPFSLSPIQRVFFEVSPQGHNEFNQNFFLRLTQSVISEKIAEAVHEIVRTHSMTRARFTQDHNGKWVQAIGTDTVGSYHYQEHFTTSIEAANVIFSSGQKRLDIKNGPIISADLINIGKEQYLFLVAHHLVVDLVSWRIILGDLEDYLTTGAISNPPSLSFQTWCRLQDEYAEQNLSPEQAILDSPMPHMSSDDYWGISGQTNLFSDVVEGGFALDEKITASLFQEANTPFQTEPVELFQAALLYSFFQTFSDRSAPIIWNEGHGREAWDSGIDVARTVGWFTTMWPLHIHVSRPDLLDIVRQTKDQRRSIPSNGWAHFTSSLHPKAQGLPKTESKEILFNYLGQYQQLERSDSLFQSAIRPETLDIAGDMQRFALFEISVLVRNNCLHFDFYYNKHTTANRPIRDWISNCERSLKTIAMDFPSQSPKFTLSDFPLIHFTYDTMDQFIMQALPQCGISSTEVEDIYPVSPIQRGILLSQAKNDKFYQNFITWKVCANNSSSPVEVDRIIEAWRILVSRHTILRTVFVKSVIDSNYVDQVVLKKAPCEECIIPLEEDMMMTHLLEQHQPTLADGRLPYRFTAGQKTPKGDVLCVLEINHAILDGTTAQILQQEFQLAYDGNLPSSSSLAYRDYISYLSNISESSNQEYWATYLEGITPCLLPITNINSAHVVDDRIIQPINIDFGAASYLRSFCNHHQLTLSNLFQVAWGLVLKYYAASDSVCFGYLNSGRDIPIPLVEDAVGPFINILVCRMDLSSEASIMKALRDNQTSHIGAIEHQHCALSDIIRMANLPDAGPLFNTIMSLQVARESGMKKESSVTVEAVGGESRSEYDLTIDIVVGADSINATMSYWKSTLAEEIVRNISDAFRQAVHEIINNFNSPISHIEMLGDNSRKILQNWNREAPTQVLSRVDDLIRQRCLELTTLPAVCAWDGEFSYSEVDDLSSKLAIHLSQYDIRPNTLVPICFEKSRWTVIAMLAVIKASGAFILLDPSYPVQRLQEIYDSAEATVVLSSEQQTNMVATFAQSIVTIGDSEQEWTAIACSRSLEDTPEATVSSKDALYAVFTSGSTGKPKGIIIEHQAFVTGAMGHSIAMHLNETSRVLQFSSYAFDVSIAEQLTTLLMGGCICVPSDTERNDLPMAVARMRVNLAILTPSVAKISNPRDLPSLRTMVITGELISEKELKSWQENVDLYFLYGPSESSVFCAATKKISPTASGRNLGFTFGCRSWIVDPRDHQKLSPIGAIGELLIEGPIVARSYLKNPEKTKESFVQAPAWLEDFGYNETFPIYKTGDLVKYNSDGSLYYISRKDTQAKLRGQRLELGEVEYHLRELFPNAQDAIAEIVKPTDNDWPPALIAFIALKNKKSPKGGSEIFDTPDGSFKKDIISTISKLDSILPVFMVPTIFIPLTHTPLTKTGKTDRGILRVAAASLTRAEIETFMSTDSVKRAPTTVKEGQFQRLFADVFGLHVSSIGIDDNFFRLGGDSIISMRLIPMARHAGYAIDMADIFNHPKLCDLAAASRSITAQQDITIAPFSLISDSLVRETMIQAAAEQCRIPTSQIKDMYPCTPLQEGIVILSIKTPGHFIATFEYEIAADIDFSRFQMAWNATVLANLILRTRVVSFDSGIFQVVVEEKIPWNLYDDEAAYEEGVKAITMKIGEELVHFGVIKSRKDPSKGFRFHLTLHHALYDASSLALLWNQMQQAYYNDPLPFQPFNRFIEYILQSESAENFWRSECAGLTAPIFPALQSSRYIPSPSSSLSHVIADLNHTATKYTASTLIRMAWAIIISSYTDSEDVVYGLTVNGRSAPIPGIEQLTGPTIATFPMRINVHPGDSVEAALSSIQQKTIEMIPFQQCGLQNIRQFSEDTASACNFQCHLGIQAPVGVGESSLFSSARVKHEDYRAFANYSLVIICHLPEKGESNDILIAVSYDDRIMEPEEVTRMMHQFEGVLRQLADSAFENHRLDTLDLLCPQDRKQIADWNAVVPSPHETCLHDLVLQHSIHRPNAPAISSWDGDMTFGELELASLALAQHLKAIGVRPGIFILLCFERSKWSVIAMIAVLQLGAACVCLDPAHPRGRIQEFLDQTHAEFILASSSSQHIMADSGVTVIVVPILDEKITPGELSALPVTPHDVAFIIFTSGSTGTPKGVLLEHRNLATSIRDYSNEMQINQHTRALHFASYAFDASIYEIFGALVNGGCLCIPSEDDKMNNIDLFINEYKVNWAFLTPSFITLMRPETIPGVRTIILGGEAVTQENVRTWASKVTLINGYGPAESTVCAVGRLLETNWKQGTIGRVTGGVGWITMPSDPSRLAPIGAVGELLIEGAVLSRGYLHDPKTTAASYITSPPWHRLFRPDLGNGRLYRSGDLFQYNSDGTIRYIGRRDGQVKLRGQRIELGDIEENLKRLFPDALDLVAEVVVGQNHPPSIMAFIANAIDFTTGDSPGKTTLVGELFNSPNEEFLTRANEAATKLRQLIPDYMVPAVFLQLPSIPRTSSDKADRKKLRECAAALSRDQIREFTTFVPIKRKPVTEEEKALQSLWAEIFKIPSEEIGADDDFFHLGPGDSIIAMRLVGLARRRGLRLHLSYIFEHSVLSDLAAHIGTISPDDTTGDYCPGSLLGITNPESFATQVLPESAHLFKDSNIIDILPTTEFQSQLLRTNNVTYSRLYLPTRINPDRVEAACHALLRKHTILRTLFISYKGDIFQMVLRTLNFQMLRLSCDEDLAEFSKNICSQDSTSLPAFGAPHFQPILISRSESDHILILRMTHAQYDGVSIPIIQEDFASACNGYELQTPSLTFAHYLCFRVAQKSPETYNFWRQYLSDSQVVDSHAMGILPQSDAQEEYPVMPLRDIPIPSTPKGITLASLVRAAWAVILGKMTKQRDVVFGNVINGRDAPLEDIETLSGPTVTVSPFRATIQSNWTVRDLLDHVQAQYTRTIPFSNVDAKEIAKHSTTWSPEISFGSILTHQNVNDATYSINGAAARWDILNFGIPADFHVVTSVKAGRLYINFHGSSKRIRPDVAEETIDRFSETIIEFAENPLKLLDF